MRNACPNHCMCFFPHFIVCSSCVNGFCLIFCFSFVGFFLLPFIVCEYYSFGNSFVSFLAAIASRAMRTLHTQFFHLQTIIIKNNLHPLFFFFIVCVVCSLLSYSSTLNGIFFLFIYLLMICCCCYFSFAVSLVPLLLLLMQLHRVSFYLPSVYICMKKKNTNQRLFPRK